MRIHDLLSLELKVVAEKHDGNEKGSRLYNIVMINIGIQIL